MTFLGLEISSSLVTLFLLNTIFAYSAYAALIGGALNLSFPAFIGLGAYASAIFTVKEGFNPVAAAAVGIVLSMAVGALVSLLLRRLGGVFLAIATVNLVFLVQVLAVNLVSITGGAEGITGVSRGTKMWELILVAGLGAGAFWLLARSRMGPVVSVRRDDSLLTSTMGLSAMGSGIVLVMASAGIASLGGSLRAHYFGFVDPSDYGLTLVVSLIAMAVVGGLGHWAGPIVGAAFFTFVPQWTRSLGAWSEIATAVILLVVVRYAPDGVLGLIRRLVASGRMRRSRSGVVGDDDDLASSSGESRPPQQSSSTKAPVAVRPPDDPRPTAAAVQRSRTAVWKSDLGER